MSPKPGKPVCKFHPKCSKDSCSFLHPQQPNRQKSGEPSSPKDVAEKPCRHFLRGNCVFGADCRRSHDSSNNDTGANETNSSTPQSDKQSGTKSAQKSDPTSPMVSEDAVAVEDNEPCPLYLMGQCTVEACEFNHPGEKVISRAALRPSNLEKSPTQSTYPATSSLNAPETFNWGDNEREEETGVHALSDDHPRTQSSASKFAVTHNEPSSSPSSPGLQAPPTACPPTFQVSQSSQQIVASESRHCPHISEVVLHWSQFADPLARADLPFCKLHAQGKCMKAESCTFRHSLTVEEYFSLFRDPQPTTVTLRREQDPIRIEATVTTLQPVIPPTAILPLSSQTYPTPSAPIISNVISEPKECFYFRSGKCRNGDRCPFAHVRPQPPAAETTSPESNDDDNWSPMFTQKSKINKPCQFFNSTYGYCRNGPDCLYLHQADVSSGPSGPQSSLEADNEIDCRASNDNKEDDNGWGQDWGKHGRLATGDTHNQEEREDDQVVNEWTKPQDSSFWEADPAEETPKSDWENRSSQSSKAFSQRRYTNRPCYQFKEGSCRWGMSCKYAHDGEPRNAMGYRSATPNLQVTNGGDDWSSTRREDQLDTSARPAMIPDFAETHDLEPWEKSNVEAEPEDPPKKTEDSPLIRPQTGDDNDDGDGDGDGDGWNATWTPAQEPINLPLVKSKEYCLAYGQGYCSKGDTCQYRHADPDPTMAPFSQQAADSPFPAAAPENENSSSIDTVPASTNIPHELSLVSNVSSIYHIDHPKVEKLIMSATVSFGPVFAPVSIETLAESRGLRLSNLPPDMTIADVRTLVQPCGGTVLENTLRNSKRTASVQVDFADTEQARNAFEYLQLQEYSHGGRKLITSFANVTTVTKLRRPADKDTLRVSWPKPTLSGWSHYPTITKAKEEAARLNGVIVKGRNIQVEFCSPGKRQRENFAIKFSNLSLETTKDEIGQLCEGHTLTTGFDIPTYKGTSLETIKGEFHSFGEHFFDRVPNSEGDEGPNLFAFVTFPCEAIAQEVITGLSSRKLDYIGDQCLEIEPIYFARYRVSRRIFDVVRQEIERIKEDGTTNYTVQYDEIFGNYHIRLIAPESPLGYSEFVKANAELCALLQGKTARTYDGNILWDDYFEMPTSVKALQHFLKSQANSIIPDERMRRIRLFGSKTEQKRAMEPLLKLLSKVLAQRYEVTVPRGSMHSLIERFETIQKDLGVNKVTFDVLSSKIIFRGTNEERSEVQNLVDSLNSSTVYKRGCCEICHHQPDDPKILVCLHVYCTSCLRMALRSASHGPLRCIAVPNSPSNDAPGQQCLAHIPYIDDILPPAERDRLLLSSFLAHVRDSQDLFVCPSVDCKAVYRTGRQGLNLHCSRCQTEICSFCQSLAHIGLSCSELPEM